MLDRPRIVSIPNGVPIPAVAWQVRPGWRESPRAVFVGRLAKEKGLDTLITAWPIVRASYHEARLTLTGEGPERAHLEALVRSLGLGDRSVCLPGGLGRGAPTVSVEPICSSCRRARKG